MNLILEISLFSFAAIAFCLGSQHANASDYTAETIQVLGAKQTVVNAINENGDLCGYYSDQDGVHHAFALIDGKIHQIEATYAMDINNQGIVVGEFIEMSWQDDANALSGQGMLISFGSRFAFRWTHVDGIQKNQFADLNPSRALCINLSLIHI